MWILTTLSAADQDDAEYGTGLNCAVLSIESYQEILPRSGAGPQLVAAELGGKLFGRHRAGVDLHKVAHHAAIPLAVKDHRIWLDTSRLPMVHDLKCRLAGE